MPRVIACYKLCTTVHVLSLSLCRALLDWAGQRDAEMGKAEPIRGIPEGVEEQLQQVAVRYCPSIIIVVQLYNVSLLGGTHTCKQSCFGICVKATILVQKHVKMWRFETFDHHCIITCIHMYMHVLWFSLV